MAPPDLKKVVLVNKSQITAAVFVLVAIAASLFSWEFLKRPGYSIYDSYQKLSPLKEASNTAMILVDQKSLDIMSKEEGIVFPWPREIYGALASVAKAVGAKALVYDILFTEMSSMGVADDESFASLLKESSLPVFFPAASKKGSVKEPVAPLLALPNVRLGGVHFPNDIDGVFRMVPRFLEGKKSEVLSLPYAVGEHFNFKGEERKPLLKFYSQKAIPFTSFYNIMVAFRRLQDGQALPEDVLKLKNRVWVIGYSAPGLHDLKSTPVDEKAPGALLQATAIENRFQSQGMARASTAMVISFTFVFAVLLTAIPLLFKSPFRAVLSFTLCLVVLPFAASMVFWQQEIWMNPLVPLFGGIIGGGGQFSWMFNQQWKERLRFAKSLESSMSPEMLNLIRNGEVSVSRFGETRRGCVLFSDLAGFTNLSEKLSPEKLVKVLNLYLDEVVDLLTSKKGYVDKFIGDAVMALWGAPVRMEDPCSLALEAALGYSDAVKKFNERISRDFGEELSLRARVGLHYGEVVAGNIGAKKRHNYTAIGDNVNLAARLEGLAGKYGLSLLVSEDCYKECRKDLQEQMLEIDQVVVKGKSVPVKIFTGANELSETTRLAYSKGLKLYYEGMWKEAQAVFADCPFAAAKAMAARCSWLAKNGAGEHWEKGVWKYDSK